MTKTIKSNEINGGIYPQYKSANSITFCGEFPENAEVKHIRLVGKIEVNGTPLENPILEDIDGVVVSYHKEADGIATAYFIEGIPEKLLLDVQNYILTDFEVTYSAPCPCCGK